jgi:hypothetical protein
MIKENANMYAWSADKKLGTQSAGWGNLRTCIPEEAWMASIVPSRKSFKYSIDLLSFPRQDHF